MDKQPVMQGNRCYNLQKSQTYIPHSAIWKIDTCGIEKTVPVLCCSGSCSCYANLVLHETGDQ